jgi:deoxycytidine triphosphate deaminase
MSILTKKYIQDNKEKFVLENVKENQFAQNSIDLSLGEYIFVAKNSQIFFQNDKYSVYNYNFNYIKYNLFIDFVDGKKVKDKEGREYVKINVKEKAFELLPGMHVLAYTNEWFGAKANTAYAWTCLLKSTSARIGFNHLMAGFVEAGYTQPLCLELECKVYKETIKYGSLLVQGILQETIDNSVNYTEKGSYQSSSNLKELKKTWKPEDILPKKLKNKND